MVASETDIVSPDLNDDVSTVNMINSGFGSQTVYYQKRILWAANKSPDIFGDSTDSMAPSFISIPQAVQMAQKSIDDFTYYKLLIRVHDSYDTDTIDKIAKDLKLVTGIKPYLAYDQAKETESTKQIVNYIFMAAIAIMMFLCFFSLSASMSANLYDQTKEIGVLRSIGVPKIRIKLLYFYEALILVFSSCFLGVIIGVFVGWTMKLQMDLFLE